MMEAPLHFLTTCIGCSKCWSCGQANTKSYQV